MNLEKKERNNSALLLEELLLLTFISAVVITQNLRNHRNRWSGAIDIQKKAPLKSPQKKGPGDELVLITLHLSAKFSKGSEGANPPGIPESGQGKIHQNP